MADDDVTQDDQQDEAPREDANLKRLREKAAKADAVERELLFVKAGIDTDSRLGKLALAGYDGDLTVDAVKAFAAEIGVTGTVASPPAVEISDDERALAQDRAVLAGGRTDPAEDRGENPIVAGLQAFNARMQRGSTREHASGEFYDRIFDAAAKGDARTLYDPQRFRDEINQNL